ncbi:MULTISPECIES: hypothetical protein [unclassified Bradyrhizobium]
MVPVEQKDMRKIKPKLFASDAVPRISAMIASNATPFCRRDLELFVPADVASADMRVGAAHAIIVAAVFEDVVFMRFAEILVFSVTHSDYFRRRGSAWRLRRNCGSDRLSIDLDVILTTVRQPTREP